MAFGSFFPKKVASPIGNMGDKGRSPKLNKTAKIAKKTAKTLIPGHGETPKYLTRPFFHRLPSRSLPVQTHAEKVFSPT
jgi:hypothetical protein